MDTAPDATPETPDDGPATVPALVGLEIGEAHALALAARVVIVSADPVDPLPPTGIVTAQQPLAGYDVEPATAVEVLVETRGGGGGGGVVAPSPPPPLDPAASA
jgi:hypothetical protein